MRPNVLGDGELAAMTGCRWGSGGWVGALQHSAEKKKKNKQSLLAATVFKLERPLFCFKNGTAQRSLRKQAAFRAIAAAIS